MSESALKPTGQRVPATQTVAQADFKACVEDCGKWPDCRCATPPCPDLAAAQEELRKCQQDAIALQDKVDELRQALAEEMSDDINVQLAEARDLLRLARVYVRLRLMDDVIGNPDSESISRAEHLRSLLASFDAFLAKETA